MKSNYSTPKLTVYGNVVDLTASGTAQSCEYGVSGNSGNCHGPNKPEVPPNGRT